MSLSVIKLCQVLIWLSNSAEILFYTKKKFSLFAEQSKLLTKENKMGGGGGGKAINAAHFGTVKQRKVKYKRGQRK